MGISGSSESRNTERPQRPRNSCIGSSGADSGDRFQQNIRDKADCIDGSQNTIYSLERLEHAEYTTLHIKLWEESEAS